MSHETRYSEGRTRPAFTIVELMLVIGIIAILIALVMVGMRGAQNAAARAASTNSLRQMVAGYVNYTTDNRGRLMPGYFEFAPKTPHDLLLNAKLRTGEWLVPKTVPPNPLDYDNASPYVWRLAPYLADDWRVMMTDYRERGIINYLDGKVGDFKHGSAVFGHGDLSKQPNGDPPTIATAPAYGLNSIFLGGDNRHGGLTITTRNPWVNHPDANPDKIAATRMTEVRNPAGVIVFAPVGLSNPGWVAKSPTNGHVYLTPEEFAQPRGYPELRPPFLPDDSGEWSWSNQQWRIGARHEVEPVTIFGSAEGAGLPITRRGTGYLPVANLDGSAQVEDIQPLSSDMRRWSPFQVGTELPPIQ